MTVATEFDFAVPYHDSEGRVWYPVAFEGTDATGDPSEDYDAEGGSHVFGRVTAHRRASGCSHTCYREYPSRRAARAAAVRLCRKLQAATSVEEHNEIVDAWYRRA